MLFFSPHIFNLYIDVLVLMKTNCLIKLVIPRWLISLEMMLIGVAVIISSCALFSIRVGIFPKNESFMKLMRYVNNILT